MGTEPADHNDDLWTRLRAHVETEDPVPAQVLADAYAALDRRRKGASEAGDADQGDLDPRP
jgi:hypothetical protein